MRDALARMQRTQELNRKLEEIGVIDKDAINKTLYEIGIIQRCNEKLYCVVDANLSKSQQGVQAAHGVAQYLMEHPYTKWTNGTLIVLKSYDLSQWEEWAESVFREPDLDNRITACVAFGKPNPSEYCQLM
jgi:hypothetical protein